MNTISSKVIQKTIIQNFLSEYTSFPWSSEAAPLNTHCIDLWTQTSNIIIQKYGNAF